MLFDATSSRSAWMRAAITALAASLGEAGRPENRAAQGDSGRDELTTVEPLLRCHAQESSQSTLLAQYLDSVEACDHLVLSHHGQRRGPVADAERGDQLAPASRQARADLDVVIGEMEPR